MTVKKESNRQKDISYSNAAYHAGFRDLAPHYNKLRFGRSKDLADHWVKLLGDKLVVMTVEEARKIFQKYLEEGNKLTY
jgi:hypothetical protein